MLETAAGKTATIHRAEDPCERSESLLMRKLWLPKLIYSALPYFYITIGLLAFAATIYVHQWFWVVPHYLLFSAACLHLGIMIFRRRHTTRSEDN